MTQPEPALGKKLSLSITLIFASLVYAFWQRPADAQPIAATTPTSTPSSQIPSTTVVVTPPHVTIPVPAPVTTPTPIVATPAPAPVASPKPTPAPAPAPKPTGQYADGSYTGSAADAYYGQVQVKAIISGGRLTDVQFLQHPQSHSNSVFINNRAMPLLTQEAISAQSAQVNGVSGATFTSDAFKQSLASALSQAKA